MLREDRDILPVLRRVEILAGPFRDRDGVESYTARTEDDKPRTILTKTDAPAWLASVLTKSSRKEWEQPARLLGGGVRG